MLAELKKMRVRLAVNSLLVFIIIVIALFAARITPHDPYKTNLAQALLSPCREFPFGTDHLGRCVLSRILSAAPLSIFSALAVVFIVATLGTFIGVISGYMGGIGDAIIMRITMIFQAFPYFLLAVAVAGMLGIGLVNGILSLIVVFWTTYARLGRSLVLGIKNENYIKAAKLCGAKSYHIIFKYMIPNIASPILVTAILDISAVILSMAGLSFLGLGAQRPTAEWGAMMSEGRNYLQTAPWTVAAPGMVLFLVVVSFNLLGDKLREFLDRRVTGN
ncbi:ABC transporter permease [Geosporobacter ferrireducens]|uniref:Nickel ABC transporter permease subunit NikC n=2 Tax=Geosporobacter ferrireducens TaxID=1424294 RepID=A0A1D8GNN8_9FIRM|nr:ABC transporter permease [Geosporobacter ferrireducens]AOT72482.1 nickel ABC transporter permease subunit NikC [Geosporobacter ferrireducens]MTI58222.1 ABC transporter permease [Geosporobacter ferrireducens]